VASMTERNPDKSLGRGFMGDVLRTTWPGLFGGRGTTRYAENIGVMAATRVYSTAAYMVAGLFAVCLAMIPKFGALIVSIPAGVLGGATTVLYGLIVVLGGGIWVENKVDFKNPVNLFPAAIGVIMGAANFSWTSKDGNYSFTGIAIATFATIIIYHLMRWGAHYGINRGVKAEPTTPEPVEGDTVTVGGQTEVPHLTSH